MRRLALLAALAALVLAAPAQTQVGPCADPNTVPLETQDWWPDDSRHFHNLVCGPLEETVAGTVSLQIQMHLHNNTGGYIDTIFKRVRLYNRVIDLPPMMFPRLTCAAADCMFTETVTFDTTLIPNNGWVELVVQPKHRVAGQDQIGIVDVPVYVNNPGKPVASKMDYDAGGCGFYGYNYACAGVVSQNVPIAAELMFPGTMPLTFMGRFAQAICSSKPGCVQNPVTEYRATLDPAMHAEIPSEGTLIQAGPIIDPTTGKDPGELASFTFDPALYPGTGLRKIMLRAIQPDPPGNGGILDGTNQGVVTFLVSDGVE
jgi:hypothetical protein